METLANLAKILRRSVQCSKLRMLANDIAHAIATDSENETAELLARAEALGIVRKGDAFL